MHVPAGQLSAYMANHSVLGMSSACSEPVRYLKCRCGCSFPDVIPNKTNEKGPDVQVSLLLQKMLMRVLVSVALMPDEHVTHSASSPSANATPLSSGRYIPESPFQ